MIKALDYNANLTNKTVCTLFADTKEEVTGEFTIVGLPQGVKADYGSKLITSTGDIALLDSEGTWNWLSSGGSGSALPEVTTDDNGDVLTVVEGVWNKATPTSELPTVTSSDNGSDLTVVSGAWSKGYPVSIVAVANGVQSDFPDCIKDLSGTDRRNAFLEMVQQGKIIFQYSSHYYTPQTWNTNTSNYTFTFTDLQTMQNVLEFLQVKVTVGTGNKITCVVTDDFYTLTPYS